uniref:ELMO domain-containing protein n=1 Tax=Ditylenchus dipsaci TaxID=166011 RepID=A0A915DPP7_9BILA
MAASSFQAVWTKLASTDLSDEKAKATKEIHDSTVQVLENSTASSSIFNKLLPTVSRPLRSTTLVDEQLLIVALSKVAFCNSDPVHWELLYSIFRFTMDDSRDQAVMLLGSRFRVSNGLTSQMIGQLLELSNDHLQGFPLAVVGLNFTQMILERVKQSKLNYIATKENSFVSCVNGIYRGSFIVFMRMWKSRNCSIGDFAAVSSEIKELIKRKPKQLLNMAILSHSA